MEELWFNKSGNFNRKGRIDSVAQSTQSPPPDKTQASLRNRGYKILNNIVDFIVGKTPKEMQEVKKMGADCHNKYVKGQMNQHGNPIYDLDSDHPNWNDYRICLDKTKEKQEILNQYIRKRDGIAKIVMIGGVGAIMYSIYWLGTKNKK